jgi:hypothetical protein
MYRFSRTKLEKELKLALSGPWIRKLFWLNRAIRPELLDFFSTPSDRKKHCFG